MRVGVVYPQTEMGGDATAVGTIGRATEDLGYSALLMPDHVVGADPADRQPPLQGPYTEHDPFHDPFVVFGYLAAVTSRIELVTGVLILPQRQTALVAQQAADVDLLSNGRLRLGIGSGWNHVEYAVLGQDFHTRGARLDEQLTVMRELWRSPLVTYDGRFDHLDRVCINPRPTREIPIFLSGYSDAAYRRAARAAEGFVFAGPFDHCLETLRQLREHLAAAGRDESTFGFEVMLSDSPSPADVAARIDQWRAVGGTHAAVLSVRQGFTHVAQHVDHLQAVSERLGLVDGSPTR